MKVLALLAVLLSTACAADLNVRGAKVFVMRGAQPWPDLPEALDYMLEAHPMVVTIVIYPAWTGQAGIACSYDPALMRIEARMTGKTVADGCLPHELGHALRHMTSSSTAALEHDAEWKKAEVEYREIARRTWCHKSPDAC